MGFGGYKRLEILGIGVAVARHPRNPTFHSYDMCHEFGLLT